MSKKDFFVKLILESFKKNQNNLKDQWNEPQGTLTRHFWVDDLLPSEVVFEIYDAFPKDSSSWIQKDSFRERKKTLAKLVNVSSLMSDITFAIQSNEVLEIITQITGVPSLVGDPLLYAGGLSMMSEGDFLNPHIDNSHNIDRSLYRKFNALYYISPDWGKLNGGNLELWDQDVTSPFLIESRFNRLVIMETNKLSWHSVNRIVASRPRCCISNYYFSKGPYPYSEEYYHVTSFTGRPEEKLKRAVSRLDNLARQCVATSLKISRGKDQVNKIINN